MRARVSLALLVGVLCGAPQAAHAIPFGTDLSRPPSIQAGFCPNFTPFQPQPSCAWYSVNLQTGESPFPPAGNGVVSLVRVRVGGSTGPMQVVVLRGLRNANTTPSQPGPDSLFTGDAGYACCKAVALSQVFTPAPGIITSIPVNLPTRNDLAPDPNTGLYVGDFLALQILGPDVRIPFAADPGAIAGGWFPAWQPNEERAGTYGTTGAAILLNGEWNPNPAAGNAIPGLGLVRFTNNVLDVNVPGPGTLRVADAARAALAANHLAYATAVRKGGRKSRIKPVTRTTTKAGTVRVRIRPSKHGKKLLKRRRNLRVKLLVSFTPKGGPSADTKTKTVTLKASRKRNGRAR
jgi:hypothetical protein